MSAGPLLPISFFLDSNSRPKMTALPALAIEQPAVPALPVADLEAAAEYARQEKAPATRTAYRSDFASFRAW